jgi:hypothetical protein
MTKTSKLTVLFWTVIALTCFTYAQQQPQQEKIDLGRYHPHSL